MKEYHQAPGKREREGTAGTETHLLEPRKELTLNVVLDLGGLERLVLILGVAALLRAVEGWWVHVMVWCEGRDQQGVVRTCNV